jgi:hypothetical protein
MKAAYYHAPIATLLRADPDGILGELAAAHVVAAEHGGRSPEREAEAST